MNRLAFYLFSASVVATMNCHAQVNAGTAPPGVRRSPAEWNQQLGACSAQTDKTKRPQCFERLAKDAIAELDKQHTAPAAPPAPSPAPPLAPVKPPVSQHVIFVAKAKANIVSGFKDPGAVQFRNLFVSEKTMLTLCGELSERNPSGAFAGFRRFFATSEPLLQDIENPKQPFAMEKMWESMCINPIEKVE